MQFDEGTATLQEDGTWLIEVVHDNGARATQVLSEAASSLITLALEGEFGDNAKGMLDNIVGNLMRVLCMQESVLVFYGSAHPMGPVLQDCLNGSLVGAYRGMKQAVHLLDQREGEDSEQFRQLIERSGLDLTGEDDLPG